MAEQLDDPARLDDPVRLARLAATELLDSPPEEAFDRATRLATRLLGVPVALVSLVTDRRQFFKSQVGLGEPWASARETGLSHSFCQHVVTTGSPFVVVDARTDARVAGNGAIDDLGVVAYAGHPLVVDGATVGSLCAIDGEPREWSEADLAALADLASFVVDEIALRGALRATVDASESRARLARDVHDLILQCLAAAKLALELGEEAAIGPALEEGIAAARTLSDAAARAAEGPGAFRRDAA